MAISDNHQGTSKAEETQSAMRVLQEVDKDSDNTDDGPRKMIKQAYQDVQNGMVDTDRHDTPGVEQLKNPEPLNQLNKVSNSAEGSVEKK